jgi:hypothetical protein
LVSIIEEHIVNRDSIDLKGFNRLINNRTREENLYTRPTIYNLLLASCLHAKVLTAFLSSYFIQYHYCLKMQPILHINAAK